MVYGFMKQSGGHATIYSEVGHGTSVKLYFPRETGGQKPTSQGSADVGIALGRGETILLAEDDDDVRATAIAALRKLGYNVLIARNGSEALEILGRATKIDLLFTDVIMPGGMTGLDLAKKAASLRPGLKVLYTSGYADGAFGSDQVELGEHNWLTKPYTRARLAAKIRQAIGE
jgi:CheY-like chemotaxis protein